MFLTFWNLRGIGLIGFNIFENFQIVFLIIIFTFEGSFYKLFDLRPSSISFFIFRNFWE